MPHAATRFAPEPQIALNWMRRQIARHGSRQLAGVLVAGVVAVLAACGGGGGGGGAFVERGPKTLVVNADPNGIYYDAGEARLYITDDNTNALLNWDGEATTSFSKFADLPPLLPAATATQVSIGELTRSIDKTFYTTRFGFGNAGTIMTVSPTKVATNLTGLDPVRRRIAMTFTANGELIDNWFTAPPTPNASSANGNVSLVTITGTTAAEKQLVTGLSKGVGTVAIGRTLYVADQGTNKILSFPLDAVIAAPRVAASGTTVATFDPTDGLDLMTAGADGALYVGSRAGKLYRVATDGTKTVLLDANTTADPGRLQVRGSSIDTANKRIFVAIHSTDVTKAPNSVRILPLD